MAISSPSYRHLLIMSLVPLESLFNKDALRPQIHVNRMCVCRAMFLQTCSSQLAFVLYLYLVLHMVPSNVPYLYGKIMSRPSQRAEFHEFWSCLAQPMLGEVCMPPPWPNSKVVWGVGLAMGLSQSLGSCLGPCHIAHNMQGSLCGGGIRVVSLVSHLSMGFVFVGG